MKFGVEFVPYLKMERIVSLAKIAEDRGFRQLWVCDHYHNRNVYVALSEIAKKTKKIMLGPGVTNPYLTHPAVIAGAMGTLQEISGGRGMLGISAGDPFFLQTVGVERTRPVETVREAVEIIRRLLANERVEFSGKIFKCQGVSLRFRVEGRVPIYIGGRKKRMLKLAGLIADGALINASHPEDIKESLQYIRAGLGNRRKKNFDSVAYLAVSIHRELEEARKAVRGIVAFIASAAPESSLESHGIPLEDVKAVRRRLMAGRLLEAREAVTTRMIEAFSICGKVEDLVERVEEIKRMKITTCVIGSPIGPEPEAVLKKISSEIIGSLQTKL